MRLPVVYVESCRAPDVEQPLPPCQSSRGSPSRITVSYSVVPRWPEPPSSLPVE